MSLSSIMAIPGRVDGAAAAAAAGLWLWRAPALSQSAHPNSHRISGEFTHGS